MPKFNIWFYWSVYSLFFLIYSFNIFLYLIIWLLKVHFYVFQIKIMMTNSRNALHIGAECRIMLFFTLFCNKYSIGIDKIQMLFFSDWILPLALFSRYTFSQTWVCVCFYNFWMPNGTYRLSSHQAMIWKNMNWAKQYLVAISI